MSVSQMSSEISTKVPSAGGGFTFDSNTQSINTLSSISEFFVSDNVHEHMKSCVLTEPCKPCEAHELGAMHKQSENVYKKTAEEAEQKVNSQQADDISSENGYIGILATVSALGSAVNIYKKENTETHHLAFQSVGGQSFHFSFQDDISIMENKDGSTSVYFSETNTTRVHDAFGNSRDFEGNNLGKKGDTVLVNINGKSVRLGDGNNTIINFVHGASIEAGDGNNLLFSYVSEQSIRLGNGDNCMRFEEMQYSSSFSLGDGNNKIVVHGLEASTLSVGHGKNVVNIGEIKNGSELILGNGSNTLELAELFTSVSLTLGDGSNKISLYRLRSDSSMFVGHGNNIIKIKDIADSSKVSLGDGNNIFSAQNINYNSELTLGSGDNTLVMCDMVKALLRLGDGHNNISLYDVDNSKVFLGLGNNTLDIFELEMSSLDGGDGNNTVNVQEAKNSKIQLGEGKNSLHSMRFENSLALVGNGDNFIQVFIANRASVFEIGDGDNACIIDYLFDTSKLSLGKGNNDIYLHEIQKDASLILGSGDNSMQIHTVVSIESICVHEGNSLGVIAHHAQSESVYLVGNIFYAQAQLETSQEASSETAIAENNPQNVNIANEIDERRKLRKGKNLAVASESAKEFNPHMTANAFIKQNQTWQSQKDSMEQKFLVPGKKDTVKNNTFLTDNKLDGVLQSSHFNSP